MKWQDAIFTVGSIIFIVSLLPALLAPVAMPLLTSIPTAIVLTAYSATMVSLKLKYSAIATGLSAVCWWLLALKVLLGLV